MPINIPDGLPAKKTLQENVFCLEEEVQNTRKFARCAWQYEFNAKNSDRNADSPSDFKVSIQVTCDFMRISS